MTKVIITIIVIGAVAGLVFILKDSSKKEEAPILRQEEPKIGAKIGNIAPDFSLIDYDGREIRLSDFKNKKPVFINFWASWCPFCVDEMPLMARIQKQFGEQYATLAINRGEDQKTGQKFTDQLGVTKDFILLNDLKDEIYAQYGGFAMPYSLFLDESGRIIDVKLGPLTEEELIGKINKILPPSPLPIPKILE